MGVIVIVGVGVGQRCIVGDAVDENVDVMIDEGENVEVKIGVSDTDIVPGKCISPFRHPTIKRRRKSKQENLYALLFCIIVPSIVQGARLIVI